MDATLRAARPVPTEKLAREIKLALIAHNSHLPSRSRLTTAAIKSRTDLILTAYKEAWSVGHEIHRPANLGLNLAQKVLNNWRQRGLARSTVSMRWAALRHFSVAIGKAGMLPPLEQLWPAEDEQDQADQTPKKVLARLSDEQYRHLLERLKQTDPSYWIVRLERELGLSHQEALATNFVIGANRIPGMLIVSSGGGRKTRTLTLTGPDQRRLVADVVAFVERRGRETLCWPRMSLKAASQKISDSLSYYGQCLKEQALSQE